MHQVRDLSLKHLFLGVAKIAKVQEINIVDILKDLLQILIITPAYEAK